MEVYLIALVLLCLLLYLRTSRFYMNTHYRYTTWVVHLWALFINIRIEAIFARSFHVGVYDTFTMYMFGPIVIQIGCTDEWCKWIGLYDDYQGN